MTADFTMLAWIICSLSAFMIGMAKTGFNGLGTIVVPMMALQFGGMHSTGMVLPLLIFADIFGVINFHRHAHLKTLIALLPWALIGVGLGLWVGKLISPSGFKHLIAYVLLLSIGVMFLKELIFKSRSFPKDHKVIAGIFGVTGGFSTMIGNAAGPVMSIYLLMKDLPKKEFIGTAAWFFFVVNLIKLPLQIWVWDNIAIETLYFSLKMLPFIALGAWAGVSLVKVIPEKVYRWFIFGGTLISSIALFF